MKQWIKSAGKLAVLSVALMLPCANSKALFGPNEAVGAAFVYTALGAFFAHDDDDWNGSSETYKEMLHRFAVPMAAAGSLKVADFTYGIEDSSTPSRMMWASIIGIVVGTLPYALTEPMSEARRKVDRIRKRLCFIKERLIDVSVAYIMLRLATQE
jgi:hypothetical protein